MSTDLGECHTNLLSCRLDNILINRDGLRQARYGINNISDLVFVGHKSFQRKLTKKSSTLTHDVRQVCSDETLNLSHALHPQVIFNHKFSYLF